MKKLGILTIMAFVFLVGCGDSKANTTPLSASQYIEKLKESGHPIGLVVDYTAETDPNELLGRPNQYTSKSNFADTTIEQLDPTDPDGGSVEVFKTKKDAENRKKYIDSIGESMPMLTEYNYINGTVLLRLSKSLTPDQAEKYKETFMEIK